MTCNLCRSAPRKERSHLCHSCSRLCSSCKVNRRAKRARYCLECKAAYMRQWRAKQSIIHHVLLAQIGEPR